MSGPEPADSTLLANLSEFNAMFGAEVTAAIVAKYLDSSAQLIAQIQNCLPDRAQLRAKAHNLKGASLNMGAEQVAHACATVESQCDAAVNDAVLAGLIDHLVTCFDRVRSLLKASSAPQPQPPAQEG